jgi:hypothetical protein
VRDDLADDGRDRRAVAEDPALDLCARYELFDEHLVVVLPRELDGRAELGLVVRLGDADRRAESRRLDEHRVPERVLDLVAGPQRVVTSDDDAALPQHLLREVLVHADGGGSDAGADVRDAGELEQALHRSVLAERAVEDREDDIYRAQRRGDLLGLSRNGQRLLRTGLGV